MSDDNGADYTTPPDLTDADHPAPGLSWRDVDLSDVVAGVVAGTLVRPTPTLLRVHGGDTGLLYPGKVHGVHGVGGCGKTWLAAVGMAERIKSREHVILIDLEDTPATIVERLVIDLRVDPQLVLEFLHYIRPTEAARHGMATLRANVIQHRVTLIVLDSTGEALANDSVKQNEDHEVARWMRTVARSTADMGPAVLLLDHVPKSDEATLMPIGSQRKQAAMNGAIYSLQVDKAFARGTAGRAKVICGKDRQGTFTRGQVVAEIRFTPTGEGRTDVELVPHEPSTGPDGTFRPTYLMEKVSRFLESNPGASTRSVRSGVKGKSDAKDLALETLIREGYVTTEPGSRGAKLHTSMRPFFAVDDWGHGQRAESTVTVPVPIEQGTGHGHTTVPGAQSGHARARSQEDGCPLHGQDLKPGACNTCEELAR